MDIIDRRPNPHGKNAENRRRVLARARGAVQSAVREAVAQGRIRDTGQENAITIPADVLHEPSFHRVFGKGVRQFVLPGNKEFVPGDRLRRPPGGDGEGGGEGAMQAIRVAVRILTALSSHAMNFSICSSTIWNSRIWLSVRSRRPRAWRIAVQD